MSVSTFCFLIAMAINTFTKPSFILLKINHSEKSYLKKGMTIKVVGYTVRGEEGGKWTNFKTIEILEFHNGGRRSSACFPPQPSKFSQGRGCWHHYILLGECMGGEDRHCCRKALTDLKSLQRHLLFQPRLPFQHG
jgi:hypothetical protein